MRGVGSIEESRRKSTMSEIIPCSVSQLSTLNTKNFFRSIKRILKDQRRTDEGPTKEAPFFVVVGRKRTILPAKFDNSSYASGSTQKSVLRTSLDLVTLSFPCYFTSLLLHFVTTSRVAHKAHALPAELTKPLGGSEISPI